MREGGREEERRGEGGRGGIISCNGSSIKWITYRPVGQSRGAVDLDVSWMREVEHGIIAGRPGMRYVGIRCGEVPVHCKELVSILS